MDLKVTNVEMSKIRISPKNYRKTIDEKSIEELASNIRQFGLINPITVRPVGIDDYLDEETGEIITTDGGYEIVCGERRYRACKLLWSEENERNEVLSAKKKKMEKNFQTIPCVVRELSDDDAFDAMMTENLLREDVDPFEESYAFNEMMKMSKSIEDIAEKFGKSISFIRKRLVLENVIPEIRDMVQKNDLSMSVAMYMARFKKEQQECALKDRIIQEGISEKNLRSSMEWNMQKKLGEALFGIDEDIEGFKRCSACPNNSACQGKLFGEDVENPYCMDVDCFKKKSLRTIMQKVKEMKNVTLVYRGEPNKELAELLAIEKIPLYDFWKSYRMWYENSKPKKRDFIEDSDDEDEEEYFNEQGYQDAMNEYERKCEEALNENPNKYNRIVLVSDYERLNFEVSVAIVVGSEDYGEKTECGGKETVNKKDSRLVALDDKDKKNRDKMNENLIKDLRERIGNEGYEDSGKPLSDVERKVLPALLFLECGYAQQESMGVKSTEVSRHNLLERDFNEEGLNRLIRGYILSKVTDGGVTWNKTKQECLKAVMKDIDKLGYDVAAEKYETVYNRRKDTIDKKIREIENEVQN